MPATVHDESAMRACGRRERRRRSGWTAGVRMTRVTSRTKAAAVRQTRETAAVEPDDGGRAGRRRRQRRACWATTGVLEDDDG
uniref:Uncharacterized protein n=1 Tax=Oryza meridionalis TaxID=40149 RepID=A0A0E0CM13_9ORYZ